MNEDDYEQAMREYDAFLEKESEKLKIISATMYLSRRISGSKLEIEFEYPSDEDMSEYAHELCADQYPDWSVYRVQGTTKRISDEFTN